MDLKSKIILISGPTASGKSNFALKLAKKVGGEIINADSMQVYKQLQILTARPKKKEIKKIKHHLYGFFDVKKKYSTGEWLKLLLKKIKYIRKIKKVPIIVGGTGLYFKALTDGLVSITTTIDHYYSIFTELFLTQLLQYRRHGSVLKKVLSHQIGSFFGAYLGGLFYDLYGSYDYAWYLAIALSIFAGLIHLPIKEQSIERTQKA